MHMVLLGGNSPLAPSCEGGIYGTKDVIYSFVKEFPRECHLLLRYNTTECDVCVCDPKKRHGGHVLDPVPILEC